MDELTVSFGDLEVLAEELAGFGADVTVLAPPELRDAVVRRLQGVLDSAGLTGAVT
jgi:predicted DNA-binding transcriptional regulator YafY